MKLRALRLHNVKRFAGRGVAIENIGDGVNVLSAANEHGKSTCFEALHALFFQPHSGTPAGVQALRPYAGGNPLVEADIETASGRFRLSKQFYGGRRASVTELQSGRLLAQADEAERFIAELTRGGPGGPAGLLWVRQGVTGLEKRTKSEEESDRRLRETLLTSVQGEVEALTGGRRMAEIAAACEAELQVLVTPTLRPKAGGPFAAALEERDRLREQERQLADDVAALREALEQRRRALRRLAELEAPEEAAARAAAVAAAEAAQEAARTHADKLRLAENERVLAAERQQIAAAALDRYQAALARFARVAQQLEAGAARLAEAEARRAAAIKASAAAEAEVQAAEAAERQARDDKARLDAAETARQAAERYAAAASVLEQAEATSRRIEAGAAVLATLSVPEQVLQQLEKLDLDLVRLRAGRAAALPSLLVSYDDPGNPAVTLAGRVLPEGAEQSFSGTVELGIAGVGRLTIRSQQADDAAPAIAAAEAKLRELLVGLGVDSVTAARQRQAAARDRAAELQLDRQLLKQAAPEGIEKLRAELVRLAAARSEGLELKFDPAAIRAALAAAEARVVASRNAVREAQPALAACHQEIVGAETALAQWRAERDGLEAILGPAAGRETRLAELQAAALAAAEKLRLAEAALAPLQAKAQDVAAAGAALARVRGVAAAAAQELAATKERLADLNGQIRIQADQAVEESWQETRELLAAASARAERYEREVRTLDRLRQALAGARSAARDLYLKPVISELRPLIGLLFDDIAVEFSEATLLPESVLRNGQAEEVDRLSGGMREQLSVLTRLAFARLLARDGRPAPVILDDALVYSDDDRIERMFEALHSQAREQQIIVFSCRQRAFSRLGGNVLSLRDWVPA